MNSESKLPFPRGRTMSDFNNGVSVAELAATPTMWDELPGNIYEVADTVHGTGIPVKLRVVRNAGAAYTVTRRAIKFGVVAKDFGRVAGSGTVNNVLGGVCKPIDDAYAIVKATGGIAAIIPAYDLFYVVEEGPCFMISDSTTPTVGQECQSSATGTIAAGHATQGKYIIGVVDQTTTTDAYGVIDLVHVAGGLFAQAGT